MNYVKFNRKILREYKNFLIYKKKKLS